MLAKARKKWLAHPARSMSGIFPVLGLVLLFLLMVLGPPAVRGAGLAGEAAPDFALESTTGSNLRLSEYRGDVVLLTFWADWCKRCQEQLPELAEIGRDYAGRGLTVLAVSVDGDPAPAREAAHRHALTVLQDRNKTVARDYALTSLPLTVLVDQHGRVQQIFTSYRGGDERAYRAEAERLLESNRTNYRVHR